MQRVEREFKLLDPMESTTKTEKIADELRGYIEQQNKQSSCRSCWASMFDADKDTRKEAAQALINHINFEDEDTCDAAAKHLSTLRGRGLVGFWAAYCMENPTQADAIRARAQALAEAAERARRAASVYEGSRYDSDTSERIQGRCSKD